MVCALLNVGGDDGTIDSGCKVFVRVWDVAVDDVTLLGLKVVTSAVGLLESVAVDIKTDCVAEVARVAREDTVDNSSVATVGESVEDLKAASPEPDMSSSSSSDGDLEGNTANVGDIEKNSDGLVEIGDTLGKYE